MHTTPQILDAIAAKYGNCSDYRISKLLGTSTGSVGNWRVGRSALNPTYAVKAAVLLDWEPAYVLACVEHERAAKDERLEQTDEIRATWEKIAERFKPASLAILAAMLLGASLSVQDVRSASGAPLRGQSIHYAYYERRRRWRERMLRFLSESVLQDFRMAPIQHP